MSTMITTGFSIAKSSGDVMQTIVNSVCLSLAFVVLQGPIQSLPAATITLPLSELAGRYELGSRLTIVEFDFGTAFSTIETVDLEIAMQEYSAPACAGFTCYDPTSFNISLLEAGERFESSQFDWHNNVNAFLDHVTVNARSLFAKSPEDILTFSPIDGKSTSINPTPVSVLQDGKAAIAIELASGLLPAEIASFSIVATGTVIPEPSTPFSLAIALLAFVSQASRIRDSKTKTISPDRATQ
jgi:hypothetical protein